MRRGERRDYLNLQIDLLSEKEITTLIQMTRPICGKMGLEIIMADKKIGEQRHIPHFVDAVFRKRLNSMKALPKGTVFAAHLCQVPHINQQSA